MPTTKGEKNFYRLAKLIIKYGTKYLHVAFKQYMGYPSFEQMIQDKRCRIFHLRNRIKECCICKGNSVTSLPKKSIFTEVQFNQMYDSKRQPCGRNCACRYDAKVGIDLSTMDITITSALLLNVLNNALPIAFQQDVTNLKAARNDLIHKSSIDIQDKDFEAHWMQISSSILSIIYPIDTKMTNDLSLELAKVQKESLESLETSDVLELFKELIAAFSEDLQEVRQDILAIKQVRIYYTTQSRHLRVRK